MPVRVEFHVLQSFAPSNLNRDDTGSPKDALFGGVRRGRISSQSMKRAQRMHMRDGGLLPDGSGSFRTKRLLQLLANRLEARGISPETASQAAENALQQIGSQQKMKIKAKKDDGEKLTDYLMFIGERELDQIAELIASDAEEYAKPKSKKLSALGAEATKVLMGKGAGAVDVALYGRMLANLPEGNVDAACQVAHAISTHRVEREFDYYTAVDDRKPDDNSGADMIGTIEFNSSCYYRYSVIDFDQLQSNLAGNKDLARETVEAYARSVAEAIPSGKQNSFAAHNLPAAILVTVRRNVGPRNLANAFEQPVKGGNEGYVPESIRRMQAEWERLDAAYGAADKAFVLEPTGVFGAEAADRVPSLDALVQAIRAELA